MQMAVITRGLGLGAEGGWERRGHAVYFDNFAARAAFPPRPLAHFLLSPFSFLEVSQSNSLTTMTTLIAGI